MSAAAQEAHQVRQATAKAARRTRARHRPAAGRRVASGVVWIAVVAGLLAGVVAVNVAVLQLNLKLDGVNRERTKLRAENAALSSRLSSAAAAARIQRQAQEKLGLVAADPVQTTFVDLSR